MPILDHFGLIAPFYERFIRPKDPDELIDILELPTSGRLLDAGGGTGRVSQWLRSQARQVVVADESMGMLHQARGKGGLALINAHTEFLPFPDNSFDRVLMVDALHHVGSQPETAGELYRILAPGGLLVIEEPDYRTWQVKLVALAEKLALMRSRFLSPHDIAALFTDASSPIRIRTISYNAYVIVRKDPL